MTGADRLDRIIADHLAREGPLLPILRDVQSAFGCIDREAEARSAHALNLSRGEVHGVVSWWMHWLEPLVEIDGTGWGPVGVGAGHSRKANIALLEDLCETLKFGSPCALGGFTPYPELSALKHWPEDFR